MVQYYEYTLSEYSGLCYYYHYYDYFFLKWFVLTASETKLSDTLFGTHSSMFYTWKLTPPERHKLSGKMCTESSTATAMIRGCPKSKKVRMNDLEGYVNIRRRMFSRKETWYMRLNGAVLLLHETKEGPICRQYCMQDAIVSMSRSCISLSLVGGGRLNIQPNSKTVVRDWHRMLTKASTHRFEDYYRIGTQIGQGSFATVYKGTRLMDGATVAIKVIRKNDFDMQMARELEREMYAVKNLPHPSLVPAHAVFNSLREVRIVMDFIPGGTLKDNIVSNGNVVSESEARPVIRQILSACQLLHKLGYVHRDLKLENVFCELNGVENAKVRIADFGFVNFVADEKEECLRSMVGTPEYVAPEVARKKMYGAAVDVYAVGVMLFRMLLGTYPYSGETQEETLEKVQLGNVKLCHRDCPQLSTSCINFINSLLNADSHERPTAEEALQHCWMCSADDAEDMGSTASQCGKEKVSVSPGTPDGEGMEHGVVRMSALSIHSRLLQERREAERAFENHGRRQRVSIRRATRSFLSRVFRVAR